MPNTCRSQGDRSCATTSFPSSAATSKTASGLAHNPPVVGSSPTRPTTSWPGLPRLAKRLPRSVRHAWAVPGSSGQDHRSFRPLGDSVPVSVRSSALAGADVGGWASCLAGAKARQSSAAAQPVVTPGGRLSRRLGTKARALGPPSRSGALTEGVENMPQVGGECRELLAGGGMQDFQVRDQ